MMKILDWRRMAAIFACLAAALLITADGALAQSTAKTPTPMETAALFGTDFGDAYTSTFLNQIFGPLFPSASVSLGTPTVATVFSLLIGYFNVVCLVLGGMLLFWNITIGIMQSAHEGVILGQRWSSLWAPIRVVFAVGLLVPVPNMGGYNVAQSGVAYLVRGSTNIASSIWATAATYVISGEAPISIAAPNISTTLFSAMLKNEACILILNAQVEKAAKYSTADANRVVRRTESGEDGVIHYTTYMMDQAGQPKTRNVCGTISTPAIPMFIGNIADSATKTGIPGPLKAEMLKEFTQTHSQVIDGLMNGDGEGIRGLHSIAVEMVADAVAEGSDTPKRSYSDEFLALWHFVNDRHQANVISLMHKAEGAYRNAGGARDLMLKRITGNNCTATTGKDGANPVVCYGEGWIGAGSWYMMLAQLNNELASLTNAMSTATIGDYLTAPEKISNDVYVSTGANPGYFWGWFGADDAVKDGGFATVDEVNFWMGKVEQVFELSTAGLAALGFELSNKTMDQMMQVGQTENGNSKLRFIPGLKTGVNSTLDFLLNITSPANGADDPMIGMIRLGDMLISFGWVALMGAILIGPLTAIGNILVATGATMAIILPLMPFFFWILAVSGYFLVIVEAVVAVNLWAIGHMRMDGDGVSGEAGRMGWLMMLSLTMTPILMIFGFIVGMTIFRVTTTMVDVGITNVVAALMNTSLMTQITGLLVISVALVSLYIVIIERSFSLVSEFPGKVLRWMGAEANITSGEENRARAAAGGAAVGSYQAIGSAAKLTASGAKTIGGATVGGAAGLIKNRSPKVSGGSAGKNDAGSGGPTGDNPGGGAPGGGGEGGSAPEAASNAGNNDAGAGGAVGGEGQALPASAPAAAAASSSGAGGRAAAAPAPASRAGNNDGGTGRLPAAPAQNGAQAAAQPIKGEKGDAGKDGANGAAGKTGTEGLAGQDGRDGVNGAEGRAGKSAGPGKSG